MFSKGKSFICGSQLTPADIYAISFIRWAGLAGINPEQYPHYVSYAQGISNLPAVSRIMEKEGIQLKTFVGK